MIKKISHYFIAYVAKWLLALILKTCRLEIKDLDLFKEKAKGGRCILMLWHNRLPILPEFLSRYTSECAYTAFISNSRDGEPLAILTNSYSNGKTLRVAHNARHHALLKMISLLKQGGEILVVTPDGPRGPRYKIKSGIISAARETGAAIIPLTWSASRFWQLRSWDKMIFPKPFSKIYISFGSPIDILEGDISSDDKEVAVFLEEKLLALDREAYTYLSENPQEWPG